MLKLLESQRQFNKAVDGTIFEFTKGWDYTLVTGIPLAAVVIGAVVLGLIVYKRNTGSPE
jgi:hypothetical protein